MFYFHPIPGRMIQIDEHMFANGWNETTNRDLISLSGQKSRKSHPSKHPTAPLRQVGQPANIYLGGGFKHVLCSSLRGEDSHFD